MSLHSDVLAIWLFSRSCWFLFSRYYRLNLCSQRYFSFLFLLSLVQRGSRTNWKVGASLRAFKLARGAVTSGINHSIYHIFNIGELFPFGQATPYIELASFILSKPDNCHSSALRMRISFKHHGYFTGRFYLGNCKSYTISNLNTLYLLLSITSVGWYCLVSTRCVNVISRDGVWKKLNFDNQSARIKYKTLRISGEALELLSWIKLRKNATDKLCKSIENTKTLDLSRLRHLFIDEAAMQSDGEGCDISSLESTLEFEEVTCTLINSKFRL